MPNNPIARNAPIPRTAQPAARQFTRGSWAADLEAMELAGGRLARGIHVLNLRGARTLPQHPLECVQPCRLPFGNQLHPALVVAVHDPTGQAELLGARADPPAITDALDPAGDASDESLLVAH